jgi:hypothetical protein
MTPEIYATLRDDLASRPLIVDLFPAPVPAHSGHMVRRAVMTPPKWYRRLCRDNPSSRKDNKDGTRTRIKRDEILRVLDRLAEGKPVKSVYRPWLDAAARQVQTA